MKGLGEDPWVEYCGRCSCGFSAAERDELIALAGGVEQFDESGEWLCKRCYIEITTGKSAPCDRCGAADTVGGSPYCHACFGEWLEEVKARNADAS